MSAYQLTGVAKEIFEGFAFNQTERWEAVVHPDVVGNRVLLQSFDRGKTAVCIDHPQAATSNSSFTKAAWAKMLFPPIPFTCPFLIIARVS
jgi:hypothetical protein